MANSNWKFVVLSIVALAVAYFLGQRNAGVGLGGAIRGARQRGGGLTQWLLFSGVEKEDATAASKEGTGAAMLAENSLEHTPSRVIRVNDNIWVAVGYGLANVMWIQGTDGVIVIDTLEAEETAKTAKEAIFAALKEAGQPILPVKAIIYTHYHADHTFGATVFAGADGPEVISHTKTAFEIDQTIGILQRVHLFRAIRQFGSYLGEDLHINSGIGPFLYADQDGTPGNIRPTRTFENELDLEVAGVKLKLIHAPGETDDQIVIWYKEKNILFGADNIYKAFPNLYAIRGTRFRDTMSWVNSLNKMIALEPEILIGSHCLPIIGKERVKSTISIYRDAIRFVHDQTVRYMNLGYTPDEIVHKVKLPPHLVNHPNLIEFYGTVEWSVRGIFTGYVGWFSGRSVDLSPLDLYDRGKKIIDLVGGIEELYLTVKDIPTKEDRTREDEQWALEIAEMILALGGEYTTEALNLKVDMLHALAARQTSANGRNYYLTEALESMGLIKIKTSLKHVQTLIHTVSLDMIFNMLPVLLKAETALDTDEAYAFRFPDASQEFTVHIYRGVVHIYNRIPKDLLESKTIKGLLVVDETVFKKIISKELNPLVIYSKGEVRMEFGSIVSLLSFMTNFEQLS